MKPSLYIEDAKTTHIVRKTKTWNKKTKKWKVLKTPILEKQESVLLRNCHDLWDLIAKVREEAYDLEYDPHGDTTLEVTFKLGVFLS